MYVNIENDSAEVLDLENLRALEVRTNGADGAAVASALAASALGTVDGDHAWLSITALKAQGAALGAEWASDFDGMISYAATSGWVDDEGVSVRAHLA